MKITKNIILIAATGLIISSCATVKLSSGGEKVRILAPNEVSTCKKLGKTSNSVTTRIVVKRPIETMKSELLIMGRNSASDMGGDTIVPLTVVTDGKQTFNIYKCIDPSG